LLLATIVYTGILTIYAYRLMLNCPILQKFMFSMNIFFLLAGLLAYSRGGVIALAGLSYIDSGTANLANELYEKIK